MTDSVLYAISTLIYIRYQTFLLEMHINLYSMCAFK